MTVAAPSGVANIQSRIAEIQSRMGAASANGAAFGNLLTSAMGENQAASAVSAGGKTGDDVVAAARKYLGIPYLYGSNDPSKGGLDCSGLVQKVFGDMGMTMPRSAAEQARQGTAVPSLAQAKPGDLVAFGSPVDHIGIYMGDNKMIVAPRRGEAVKIQEVYTTPTAIRRIIPEQTAAAGAAGFGARGGVAPSLSSQYDSLFVAAGAKYGIAPNLLAAVAKQESGFNANARSHAGAQGLMQIMPGTAKGLGVNAMDPRQAVDGAAKMLSGLVKKFGSNELALAAYNAGPGAVQKHNGIPPYKETQNYVRKVMAMARQGGL